MGSFRERLAKIATRHALIDEERKKRDLEKEAKKQSAAEQKRLRVQKADRLLRPILEDINQVSAGRKGKIVLDPEFLGVPTLRLTWDRRRMEGLGSFEEWRQCSLSLDSLDRVVLNHVWEEAINTNNDGWLETLQSAIIEKGVLLTNDIPTDRDEGGASI
jgi:hypothetical protein